MKNTQNSTLSYNEYQERLKSIKTPEEATAFAQELMMPMLSKFSQPAEEKSEGITAQGHEEKKIQEIAPEIIQPKFTEQSISSPWQDIVDNDTESMVISLYSKGMTTRDIVGYMKQNHRAELSQTDVSTITDKVFPLVKEWQNRTFSSCYPIIYLDGLHFKVRDSGKIVSKVANIVLGINQYGQKELMGIWLSESEGAKFWMGVLNDLKNRGVEDILIACVDGLKGFPEAIKAIFPNTEVQVCITHQIRHTVMFLPHKDRDVFCKDLRKVYTASTEEAGKEALHEIMEKWPQYQPYLKSWENHWADLTPFFGYPEPIRKMIYTTNAIENLNRQFRKVTKTTTVFPHNEALIKLLWLAQADISQNWHTALQNWGAVLAQLSILFPDRVQF